MKNIAEFETPVVLKGWTRRDKKTSCRFELSSPEHRLHMRAVLGDAGIEFEVYVRELGNSFRRIPMTFRTAEEAVNAMTDSLQAYVDDAQRSLDWHTGRLGLLRTAISPHSAAYAAH